MKVSYSRPHAATRAARCRGFLALIIATATGIAAARADSTTDAFITPNTSLLKGGNWASGTVPAQNITGTIAEGASANPLGWNTNSNDTTTIGGLDFITGATNLVIGLYTTKTTSANIGITLAGSTLNSQANTVIANSSGNTIVFENDVAPSSDLLTESGLTTYTLGNSTNFIQATASSNIIIDNVVTGSGDALTFLGGGNSSTTGATLELGAGSANDVVGHAAPNAPTPANAGGFTSSATVETSDKNSFTGGLTIGDAGGAANAGVVKIDGSNALPAAGTVTVNTNSQLVLNGAGTYGGAGQGLVLNGTGTHTTNGALTTTSTASSYASTWVGNVSVSSTSSINVQGASSSLAVTGSLSGIGVLEVTGAGSLVLDGTGSAFSGGFQLNSGSLVAGFGNALGTGATVVSGGTLSATVGTATLGSLTLSSGVVAADQSNFSLSTGFSMTGGTLDLTDSSGSVGSISSSGGAFSISGGTLDLGGNTWNYASTYNILTGFGSGSVSGLTITDYNTASYTASVSNSGVLSFTAVPEPSTWAAILCGLGTLMIFQSRRGRRGRALKR